MSSLLNIAAGGETEFYPYKIDNSLRFDDGSSPVLTRTPSGSGDSLTTWTWSAWVKRGNLSSGMIFTANYNSNQIGFSSDRLYFEFYDGSNNNYLISTAKLRDPSAWYHVVFVWNTSDATSSNRMRIYLNGSEITTFDSSSYPSQNRNSKINTAIEHQIGKRANPSGSQFDGYLAEINFIDGQALTPSSFGETKSGVWIPKDTSGLTFGTNGFRLEFGNSSAIGDDTSGNTNDFAATNLSTHDVVPDSPTNNYAVLNPINTHAGATLSEGNLKLLHDSGGGEQPATFAISSGKWYWEVKQSTQYAAYGLIEVTANPSSSSIANGYHWYGSNGLFYTGTTSGTNLGTFDDSDVISLAYNADDNELTLFKNGVSAGTESIVDGEYFPDFGAAAAVTSTVNFGQNETFNGLTTAGGNTDANGQGNFKYSVPSGFLALNSDNLSEPSISPRDDDIPEDYFNTVLYEGDGTAIGSGGQAITGVGFQPDWVWIKNRDASDDHSVYDVVRGVTKQIETNSGSDETTQSEGLTAFGSDGFTVGSLAQVNTNNESFVSWNWLAGGSASSNSAGDITSSVSANTEAGFSIVGYTGDGTSATRTIGCGLTKKPDMVILKNRTNDSVTDAWFVWQSAFGTASPSKYMTLFNTDTVAASNVFVDSSFSDNNGNALFAVAGSYNGVNKSGTTYITYCFHEVDGYSKFDSYQGNGNADGTFVFTGFRPAWVMLKRSSSGVNASWVILDKERDPINPTSRGIFPNSTTTEASSTLRNVDFLSNGFKLRTNHNNINGSGGTYIYMAFAEMPFKYANAR
tara:strand:+ start:252 stop:2654 length:2403 start_codon:yes stop_codon:yes gene_type:complete